MESGVHGSATPQRTSARGSKREFRVSRLEAAYAVYNWAAVAFIAALVFSQLLGIVWNTTETDLHTRDGADPTLGPRALDGSAGEPFADRVVACVKDDGWAYKPALVSDLLASASAHVVVDATAPAAVNGYRLVERSGQAQQQYPTPDVYSDLCAMISTTIDTIFVACEALGYNATQDALRVVSGLNSSTTHAVPNALPVLLVPLSDADPMDLSFAVPGVDGSACAFRLAGKYVDKALTAGVLRGVARSIREARTAEWLERRRAGGAWRNGWYEDPSGGRWHADMMSSDQQSALGIPMRQFDTLQGKELDCVHTAACRDPPVVEPWGSKSSTTLQLLLSTSVRISNGQGLGVSFREQRRHRTIQVVYDWETLISNVSLGILVARWVFAMFALQNGYLRGVSAWHNAGIGCLASSRSFNMLVIVLLPRLRVTLSAFWTVGCDFDGPQRALSASWFVVYPAVVETMLLEFSVLNVLAKVLRRRIPDAPFGPSVLFLCGLHWLRASLTGASLGVGGRATAAPLVSSAEFESLSLAALFTTDVAFRLNGNVTPLIGIKLALLGVNCLPLLLAQSPGDGGGGGDRGRTAAAATTTSSSTELLGVEKALAIQWWKVGGLGGARRDDCATCRVSSGDDASGSSRGADSRVISSYELVRLGYFVYDGKFLISIDDWRGLVVSAPLRRFYPLWNHRVTLFLLHADRGGDGGGGDVKVVHERPHMRRLDDPELQKLRWWAVVGQPVK